MPKKDAVCAVTALKEALTMCDNATSTRLRDLELCESRQMEVVILPTRKFEIYVGRRTLHCPTLQLISHLPMA